MRNRRGAALITALLMMGLLAAIVAALMLYVSQQRQRSVSTARAMVRESCASSGLQLARAYFARNFASWNTFLSTPAKYNPVKTAWNTAPADPLNTTLQGSNPELFTDLDGDGALDVYIYVRDNADEGLPAPENWAHDNDQNVIIGAACISKTLVPQKGGRPDPDQLVMEAVLSFNLPNNGYTSQSLNGTSGTGNLN
ncbi:MAG: hypothetical protein ACOZQL_28015 [Myxococcota bacterium]